MTAAQRFDAAVATLSDHAQAILQAVSGANIGVCVSVVESGVPRNIVVNDAAVDILGHPRDVLLSRPVFDFVAPEERERLREGHARRVMGEKNDTPSTTVVVRADGRRMPIMYAVVNSAIDDRVGHVSLLWSIAAQREAESALRTEEGRLRRLIASAPDGIVLSRDGVVLEANPAAARMLGFETPADLTGVSLHTLMTEADTKTMVERVSAVARGVKLAPRLYQARKQDGTQMTAEITSVPYDYEGQPAVLGFARDVTTRMDLEAKLAQTERLAALGTLAAGVAHEINNPLTMLSLGIQSLDRRLQGMLEREESDERASISGLLSDLEGSVERIGSIVRELRAFSREDDAPPRPTDLRAVLAVAQRMAAHHLRHRARVSFTYEAVPPALGDPGRLEQVFVNLLVNAAHAMPQGREENRIEVRTYLADDGRVAVDVSDNGSGMPPEVLARVFEPFFTTKPTGEGTGLGLAISYGILRKLGGEISFESEVGKGTIAHVLLQAAPVAVTEPPPRSVDGKRRSLRILVIDDEPRLALTVQLLLTPDHDVTTAGGGQQACEILLDEKKNFDVVLCDVMMVGVSGMEVYERVSKARPELLSKIIIMTGGACTEAAVKFLETVPNRILNKPFHWVELEKLLHEVTSRVSTPLSA